LSVQSTTSVTIDGKDAQIVVDNIRRLIGPKYDGKTLDEATAEAFNDAIAPPYTWELVDSDDFIGSNVDTTKWSLYTGRGNEGIGWRVPAQVTTADGRLAITGAAFPKACEGAVASYIAAQAKAKKPLSTSAQALLRAGIGGGMSHKINQTHGRWEVRARMEKGNGYGPAILLWPQSEDWPDDGEIDIFECPKGDRATAHQTLHFGADNSQLSASRSIDCSEWHTYAVEWLPDRVTFEVDGKPTKVITDPKAIPTKPMHLAIQNDVGAKGHWISGRDTSTPEVVSLLVDSVKVFRPKS
jgi:beta-glucanase (GH16 family)